MILKLNERFYSSVKNKTKIATTRTSNKGLSKGDEVNLVFTNDGSFDGKLSLIAVIESVDKLKFSEITQKHAESENHSNVDLFKKNLREFYPSLTDDSDVYYIKFKI